MRALIKYLAFRVVVRTICKVPGTWYDYYYSHIVLGHTGTPAACCLTPVLWFQPQDHH